MLLTQRIYIFSQICNCQYRKMLVLFSNIQNKWLMVGCGFITIHLFFIRALHKMHMTNILSKLDFMAGPPFIFLGQKY